MTLQEISLSRLLEKYRELERRVDEELSKAREEIKRLREENQELKFQLQSKPQIPPQEIERLQEELKALQRTLQEKEAEIQRYKLELSKWRKLLPIIQEILNSTAAEPSSPSPLKEIAENLPEYDKEVYEYLAKHPGIPFTAYQIATAVRKSPKSSAFRTALARLVKLGLVERRGGQYLVKRGG